MLDVREESLTEALAETRERTLALVAGLSDEELESAHDRLMSPLVWDLAHIAAYEDLWLGHRLGGLPLLHPDLAAMYDAFETPRAVRGELPLLDRAGAHAYLEQVRERALPAVRAAEDPTLVELVLRHEQQHVETMMQTLCLARLPVSLDRVRPEGERRAAAGTGLESVGVEGGRSRIGAGPVGFAYDNERPRHERTVAPFRIGRVPVTNATYLSFVEGGGYERREWWTDEGWAWKEEYDIGRPGGWSEDGRRCWRLDGWVETDPHAPVVHVSWFEADAFARAHGARLPTEVEWERAATWGQDGRFRRADTLAAANLDHRAHGPAAPDPATAAACGALGLLGDVWEWTASPFTGYDGFVAHPYPEYSQVFFGDRHRVLRGGSWATRARVATPTFRNWDLPQRRQIFSGIRLAWDAG